MTMIIHFKFSEPKNKRAKVTSKGRSLPHQNTSDKIPTDS